jgi:alkyl sulfatase BDS1-like metallo-beta-lactamase superfamily hydrolase
MARAMTVTQLFDTIAIRIDGPRAAGTSLSVLWHFTDSGERYLMELSNGVPVIPP